MLPAPGTTAPEMNGIRTTQIRQSTYSSPRLLGGFFVHRAVAQHSGFTLVELVVVVMILGIIASIAAPRLLSTSDTALDNSLRQTLGVVRDAIDKFAAENTALPAPTAAKPRSSRI